ncbi:MAG: hypothetical protein U5J63_06975 [Fodinibius sp.]|nr:hypothetical protein [Fodinibius sp.]
MSGWILPRDAFEQVKAGKQIDTSNGFDKLLPVTCFSLVQNRDEIR